jgi:hypothetical protein
VSAGRCALEAEHERLLAAAGAAVNVARYGFNYAARVIEADDEQGRANGWVTRYDEIRWSDLVAIATAAAGLVEDGHIGQCVRACDACDLFRALGRIRESTPQGDPRGRPPRRLHDARRRWRLGCLRRTRRVAPARRPPHLPRAGADVRWERNAQVLRR